LIFGFEDFFQRGFPITSLLKNKIIFKTAAIFYLLISGCLSSLFERKLSFSFFEDLGEDKRAVELFDAVRFVESESFRVLDRLAPLLGLVDTFLDIFLVADDGLALLAKLLRFQLRLVLASDCVAPSRNL